MILVPYTMLFAATLEALPDGQFVRVRGDDGYRLLLRRMWERGKAFTLVEHDVAPTATQLAELESCDEPWCHFGYCPGDWAPTFGCVRFSAELIAGTPDAFSDPSWPWQQLDAKFAVHAREAGWKPHWHYPHVLHLRTPYRGTDGEVTRRRLDRETELYVLQAELEMLRAEAAR